MKSKKHEELAALIVARKELAYARKKKCVDYMERNKQQQESHEDVKRFLEKLSKNE